MPYANFFVAHVFPRLVTDFDEILKHLAADGYAIKVFAPPATDETSGGWRSQSVIESSRRLLPPGSELHSLPCQYRHQRWGIPSPYVLLATFGTAFRAARRDTNDIFVTWGPVTHVMCGLAMRLFRRRCVFLLTGLGPLFGSHRRVYGLARALIKPLYRFLFRSERSRVIVHNHEDKLFLVRDLGVRPEKVTVTPGCGVDPRQFPFLDTFSRRQPPVVLVPARLIVEKGIMEAAAASEILRRRGVRHEMWFTSALNPEHPSSLRAKDLVVIQQQNDWVRFTGYQESLLPLYEVCRVVCLPTWYPEGLPTALLEAAAIGRPVVTTDIVGCREFARDNETALVVPPKSPEAIADALERLLDDDALADRLRRRAHEQFLAGFTREVALARTVAAFQDLGFKVSTPGVREAEHDCR